MTDDLELNFIMTLHTELFDERDIKRQVLDVAAKMGIKPEHIKETSGPVHGSSSTIVIAIYLRFPSKRERNCLKIKTPEIFDSFIVHADDLLKKATED